jgi:uncharacterized lipoprotein YddW (UPF0748 family)
MKFWHLLLLPLLLQPPALAQAPSDIQGHWAEKCLVKLKEKGIMRGFPDGRLQPDSPINRAAFATLITGTFPPGGAARPAKAFTDVPKGFWAYNAIQTAYGGGFLTGFPDGSFRPLDPTSRAQALSALAGGLNWKPTGAIDNLLTVLTDRTTIPNYAKGAIAAAIEKQTLVNFPKAQQLNPNANATRAEIAALICQTLPDTQGLISAQYIPKLQTAKTEIRGVWMTNIDSDVLFDRDRLKTAIQDLHQQGFNTIYPVVWNWGYTLYPSQVMDQTIGFAIDPREPGLKDRDPLQEIITEAKKYGMRVVPWFEFGFMAPEDSELAIEHPDWLSTRQDGSTNWQEGIHGRVWLSPFQPEGQQLVTDLVNEIVGKYEIDGIQFDDHFGLPAEFGYEPATIQAYQRESKTTTIPTPTDPNWVKWRADRITTFMTKTFQSIKALKPKAIVSLSPNPYGFSYNKFLQDWKTWERLGITEELFVQVYKDSLSGFDKELMQPELLAAQAHIPTGIGILAGLKGRQIPITQIEQQVKLTRDRGYSGISFFYYETLWNNTGEGVGDRKAAFKRLMP